MTFRHAASEYLPGEVPPQIQRPVLSNATTTVVNALPQPPAKPTRKRKQGPTSAASMQKRRDTGSVATPATASALLSSGTEPPETEEPDFLRPALYGVGPVSSAASSAAPVVQLEHTHFASILAKARPQASNQVATDVWYFVRPLDTAEKSSTVPENEESLKERPKTAKFVGCRLCP